MSSETLQENKFRGCLLGSLIGDCLGAPFEIRRSNFTKKNVQKFFEKITAATSREDLVHQYLYTDDTNMMKNIAESLISMKRLDAADLARRYVDEYFIFKKEKKRCINLGYGGHVQRLFHELRRTNFEDIFAPARLQFDGQGSFGNGGAMRIAPVALFYYKHKDGPDEMLRAATDAIKITHTHRDAVNGALLQCMVVDQCLGLDPEQAVDANAFLQELKLKMEPLENDGVKLGLEKPTPYRDALNKAQELLSNSQVSDEQVKTELGNEISALRSVPTAIFCYLRASTQPDLEGVQTQDPVQRTVQYAISLGGDTDTIACMAGALVGAHLGRDHISNHLLSCCEAIDTVDSLAVQLYRCTHQVQI